MTNSESTEFLKGDFTNKLEIIEMTNGNYTATEKETTEYLLSIHFLDWSSKQREMSLSERK